ncbi:MAG TPA: hypothetical protein VFQ53_03750 [Kofleriaceae bacterium]|nr:hypothetical protein [Kofleriaceae bacterium]
MITPILSVLCLAAVAHADPYEVAFEASNKPKTVWAIDADGRVVLPTAVDERPEPIALAIVYCGWEIWIGNDDYIPEWDASHYPGALHALKSAFDTVPWSRIAPPASSAVVIRYDDHATIVTPRRPIQELRGAMLGSQQQYSGTTGHELARGIELAVVQLTAMPQRKKILLVIGDGIDTRVDRLDVPPLSKYGIELRSIVYKAALSDFLSPADQIYPYAKRTRTVQLSDDIGLAMTSLLLPTEHRYVATFPHPIVGAHVYVDGVDELAIDVPHGCQFGSERTPWYPFVLVAAALLGILALMIRDRAAAA